MTRTDGEAPRSIPTLEEVAPRGARRSAVPAEPPQVPTAYPDTEMSDLRLDREAKAAARWLLETCGRQGFGSGNGFTNATHYVEDIARELGMTPEPAETVGRRRMPDAVSRAVWDRDGWECKKCGGHKELTVDHIVPIVKGGTDDFDNLQTLCKSHNSAKRDRDWETFLQAG